MGKPALADRGAPLGAAVVACLSLTAVMLVAEKGMGAPVTQMGTSNTIAAPAPTPAPAAPVDVAAPASIPPPVVASPTRAGDAAQVSMPPAAVAAPLVPITPTPATAVRPGPVPTADANPAPSDHDAVVAHWGIEARRVSPGPYPLTLRPTRGCPSAATAPCTVDLGLLGLRYWTNRDLAINVGVALALGGGKEGARTLDSYAGGGAQLGLTLLLGNWRHLAVGASPQLGVFMFKPGGSTTSSTVVVDLRAALEGELHFGFVGVPALSVGIASGLGFRYESTPDASVWSIGVVGPASAWGVLTDLFLRYYL